MRHQNLRDPLHPLRQVPSDTLVCLGVDRRERIVKDDHGRFLRQRPRNRHALLLPAGKCHAALADHCIVALGKLPDVAVDACGDCRLANLLRRRAGDADVLFNRPREQKRLLQNNADVFAHPFCGHGRKIDSADRNFTLRRRVEPAEKQ